MKHVLLYYKYVRIQDRASVRNEQLRLCADLHLKGRIIISHEGINGTVSGSHEDIARYEESMLENPLFSDIVFKRSESSEDVFKKLSVKARKEVVSLQLDQDIDLTDEHTVRGKYLEPKELHDLMQTDEEYYIIDMRNDYESAIGKFAGSIAMKMKNFRDLPKALKDINHLKDKKIITVCTGGIRCEKASAYLVREGFSNVHQLHGGIVTYGKEFPDEGFEGKCYVFDSRIAIPIATKGKERIIALCHHCNKPCDNYINCCNAECNLQFVCCKECAKKHQQACSDACMKKSRYLITANARTNT